MIHPGRYQDVLAHVLDVGAVVCDPPYGARTHKGQSQLRQGIDYGHWTKADVYEFVEFWARRTVGWMCCFTSHDLIPYWELAYGRANRYAFAPVGIIQKVPRLSGDGPANWMRYLMVARPKNVEFARWGSLPGAYNTLPVRGAPIRGVKSVELMSAIINDYSIPGSTVCDPCAGYGSTRIAAALTGRKFIGAEVDAELCALANARHH